MTEQYISSPRPMFGDKATIDGRTKRKRLEVGSKSAGVILDITVAGLYFNGWYMGFSSDDVKFASMAEPGFISWENLDKAKKLLESAPQKKTRKGKGRKKKELVVETEDKVTEEYLETLPIVTIAGYKFYVDPDKRERRLVDRPDKVTRF